MSWKHVKAVIEVELQHPEKCLLLVLASMANAKTDTCFPSLDYLAAYAGFADRRCVTRVMNRLIEKGYIEKIPPSKKSNIPSNRYRICCDKASDAIAQMAMDSVPETRGPKPHVTEGPTNRDTTIDNIKDDSKVKAIEDSNYKDALRIYEVYPRRVGKAAAVKKIQEVIKERGAEFLEDRVKTFAEGWKQRIKIEGGKSRQFIPHATTWLDRGSYDDDQSEWFPVKKKKIDYSAGF